MRKRRKTDVKRYWWWCRCQILIGARYWLAQSNHVQWWNFWQDGRWRPFWKSHKLSRRTLLKMLASELTIWLAHFSQFQIKMSWKIWSVRKGCSQLFWMICMHVLYICLFYTICYNVIVIEAALCTAVNVKFMTFFYLVFGVS